MCPSGIRRDSYRNPNGVRSPRTPGMGRGTGQGAVFDYRAFLATHFPDVNHYIASWAYHRCKVRKRTQPTVEEVRAEIEELEARR